MEEFRHCSKSCNDIKKLVFTAQSCRNFHLRMLICRHAFSKGAIPLNPFNAFGYYLYELVDRDLVRNGNNVLLDKCDELWVYGEISNGVLAEIERFKKSGRPIKFFDISDIKEIRELSKDELVFEDDLKKYKDLI